MREIKFRAWHKPTQLMDDVVLIDIYNEKIGILYADPVMQCESIQKYNFNEVELMQYTGLKDKNGKEIYEGDIVLCKIHDKEYMGLVEYTNTYGFYYLSGMGRSDTELWGCNEKKVLGNIYENPELMAWTND